MSRLAYFVGVTTAQIYRLFLTSLHFTMVVYFMWNPLIGFWEFFVLLFLSFACADVQSVLLASFIKPRNAPILTAVVAIFISLLNGYPQIPFVGVAAHSFYMTEGIFTKVVEPIIHVVNTDEMFKVFKYTYGRYGTDVLAMGIIYFIMYVIAFLLLVFMYRDQQR